MRGRLVRGVVGEVLGVGEYGLGWDGRSGDGEEVGSGVYLVRVVGGGKQEIVRGVLVR